MVLFVSDSALPPVFVPLVPATTVLRRFPAELEAALPRHDVPDEFISDELSTLGDAVSPDREPEHGRSVERVCPPRRQCPR